MPVRSLVKKGQGVRDCHQAGLPSIALLQQGFIPLDETEFYDPVGMGAPSGVKCVL